MKQYGMAPYCIEPSFTGNGFIVKDNASEVVGKIVIGMSGTPRITDTAFDNDIKVVKVKDKEYSVKNGKLEVGKVLIDGGIFGWVVNIDLNKTSQPAAHLLVFLAVVKELL